MHRSHSSRAGLPLYMAGPSPYTKIRPSSSSTSLAGSHQRRGTTGPAFPKSASEYLRPPSRGGLLAETGSDEDEEDDLLFDLDRDDTQSVATSAYASSRHGPAAGLGSAAGSRSVSPSQSMSWSDSTLADRDRDRDRDTLATKEDQIMAKILGIMRGSRSADEFHEVAAKFAEAGTGSAECEERDDGSDFLDQTRIPLIEPSDLNKFLAVAFTTADTNKDMAHVVYLALDRHVVYREADALRHRLAREEARRRSCETHAYMLQDRVAKLAKRDAVYHAELGRVKADACHALGLSRRDLDLAMEVGRLNTTVESIKAQLQAATDEAAQVVAERDFALARLRETTRAALKARVMLEFRRRQAAMRSADARPAARAGVIDTAHILDGILGATAATAVLRPLEPVDAMSQSPLFAPPRTLPAADPLALVSPVTATLPAPAPRAVHWHGGVPCSEDCPFERLSGDVCASEESTEPLDDDDESAATSSPWLAESPDTDLDNEFTATSPSPWLASTDTNLVHATRATSPTPPPPLTPPQPHAAPEPVGLLFARNFAASPDRPALREATRAAADNVCSLVGRVAAAAPRVAVDAGSFAVYAVRSGKVIVGVPALVRMRCVGVVMQRAHRVGPGRDAVAEMAAAAAAFARIEFPAAVPVESVVEIDDAACDVTVEPSLTAMETVMPELDSKPLSPATTQLTLKLVSAASSSTDLPPLAELLALDPADLEAAPLVLTPSPPSSPALLPSLGLSPSRPPASLPVDQLPPAPVALPPRPSFIDDSAYLFTALAPLPRSSTHRQLSMDAAAMFLAASSSTSATSAPTRAPTPLPQSTFDFDEDDDHDFRLGPRLHPHPPRGSATRQLWSAAQRFARGTAATTVRVLLSPVTVPVSVARGVVLGVRDVVAAGLPWPDC
ncbi:hypothetical protein H9P43_003905 [Blastocladiella emersonii ATCC 22665]|nr:hypothetical protein H9P43_003905 [Blastocladiella emersonii ATCC 22665]